MASARLTIAAGARGAAVAALPMNKVAIPTATSIKTLVIRIPYPSVLITRTTHVAESRHNQDPAEARIDIYLDSQCEKGSGSPLAGVAREIQPPADLTAEDTPPRSKILSRGTSDANINLC